MQPPTPVVEFTTFVETNQIEEVRQYLSLGWRQIEIPMKEKGGERPCYKLGWPGARMPLYPGLNIYYQGGLRQWLPLPASAFNWSAALIPLKKAIGALQTRRRASNTTGAGKAGTPNLLSAKRGSV